MEIETYHLGELQTNCYLIYDNEEVIVIDPAEDGAFIAEKIHEKGLILKAIIATHGHFDHVLGAGELQMILPAPFYVHENDKFLLKDVNSSAKFWLKREFKNPLPTDIKFLKEGDEISFGNYSLEVIETPGHAPGSVCLVLSSVDEHRTSDTQIVFTGDTLFNGAIGRYDFSYSSKEDLKTSIRKIFDKFSEETIAYPGHGEPTTLADEFSFKEWAEK